MILSIKCDGCGVVAEPAVMTTDEQMGDLCPKCARTYRLCCLKIEHAKFKEYLEQTHLKKLREMESQIVELEQEERRTAS